MVLSSLRVGVKIKSMCYKARDGYQYAAQRAQIRFMMSDSPRPKIFVKFSKE